MRQEDIMRILKASSAPMTVMDIAETLGIRPGWEVTDINCTRNCLDNLERLGFVRRAGMTRGKRNVPCVLWEAVA